MPARQEFYSNLSERIEHVGLGSLTPKDTKTLVSVILQEVVFEACRVGYFRFPRGTGSLQVKKHRGGRRLHPQTQKWISVQPSEKLKYTQGVDVKTFLAGNS